MNQKSKCIQSIFVNFSLKKKVWKLLENSQNFINMQILKINFSKSFKNLLFACE